MSYGKGCEFTFFLLIFCGCRYYSILYSIPIVFYYSIFCMKKIEKISCTARFIWSGVQKGAGEKYRGVEMDAALQDVE